MLDNCLLKIRTRSREKKYQQLMTLLWPSEESTILDVGIADTEYSQIDNYLEKRYPYPEKITGLAMGSIDEFCQKYPNIKAISYDGVDFPFEDKSFDVVFSNAVVEHVGAFDKQLHFIKEVDRVGKNAS